MTKMIIVMNADRADVDENDGDDYYEDDENY